jgi:hypothetical protein
MKNHKTKRQGKQGGEVMGTVPTELSGTNSGFHGDAEPREGGCAPAAHAV